MTSGRRTDSCHFADAAIEAAAPGVDIQPLGDAAVVVSWPNCPERLIGELVQLTTQRLMRLTHTGMHRRNPSSAFTGVVPAFASVTVHYSPVSMTWNEVEAKLRRALMQSGAKVEYEPALVEIPVCYEAPFAVDLSRVSMIHGLSETEVIRLHCSPIYTVRMIGFSPGFPYLAGLLEGLATPRLKTPRLRVPVGSVAIGGRQTGIYSLETPGGWNIIGRTPVSLFRPAHDCPSLLNAGDRVRFTSISSDEFRDWQEQQEHGS